MGVRINRAPVANYAKLRAAFPTFSAALLNAPAGSRWQMQDSGVWVRRSASGNFLESEEAIIRPPFYGSATRRIGPAHVISTGNSGGHSRLSVRPVAYALPGGKPANVAGIIFGVNAASTGIGVGSDAFDLIVWETDPEGKPLQVAPLYTWSWIAGGGTGGTGIGTGAAGNFSLVGATPAVFTPLLTFPGGTRELPGYFRAALLQNCGNAPNLSTISNTNFVRDSSSWDVVPGATFGATINSHVLYGWSIGSFAPGTPIDFSASADYVAGATLANVCWWELA